jgi:hypothetical protein
MKAFLMSKAAKPVSTRLSCRASARSVRGAKPQVLLTPTLREAITTQLWRGYLDALQEQPLLTKALTGAVGTSLGDALAQALTQPDLDICRCGFPTSA